MMGVERFARAAQISEALAGAWWPHLEAACFEFGITKPARVAAFIGQARIESANFTKTAESMNYGADRVTSIFKRVTGDARERLLKVARQPGEGALSAERQRALANIVYAGVNGNGSEASGDGWDFRGSGLLQHTGRANIAAIRDGIGVDVVADPELLRTQHDVIARAAGWRWESNGLNQLADAGKIDSITRNINGPAMLEADKRRTYTDFALKSIGLAQ